MRPRGALQSQQQPWGCVPHPDCAHAHQPSHNHLSMRAAWPPCEHMLLGGPEVQAGQRGAVPASPRPANLCTCHAMTRGAAGSQLAAQYLEEAAQQLERQQQTAEFMPHLPSERLHAAPPPLHAVPAIDAEPPPVLTGSVYGRVFDQHGYTIRHAGLLEQSHDTLPATAELMDVEPHRVSDLCITQPPSVSLNAGALHCTAAENCRSRPDITALKQLLWHAGQARALHGIPEAASWAQAQRGGATVTA